jgi:mannose-6-phosphate isomerase-like protein (cupin superfamily)
VPADLPARARGLGDADIAGNQPPPGSSRFNLIVLPPWEQFVQGLRQHRISEMDDRGFHTTKTIDYCYVIDGPLMLDMDTESVELGAGDVVVQQATRHAWRNPGAVPVRFLAVLTTFPEVEPWTAGNWGGSVTG